jgi:hypothetical protein
MAIYRNPWHKQGADHYGPAFYETEAKPIEYRGYQIYQRLPGAGVDIVKDGVCVTQRAVKTLGPKGREGLKHEIDILILKHQP